MNFFNKIKSFFKEFTGSNKASSRISSSEADKRAKRFLNEDDSILNNEFKENKPSGKEQSMKASQGISDFSGSAYNGPGNVDREKINSNKAQRNY